MVSPPATDSPKPGRRHVHRRHIEVDAWHRDDGCWEMEGRIIDLRSDDYPFASGLRLAGDPVHDMRLQWVVGQDLVIREVQAHTEAMPYPGICNQAPARYASLVGLSIRQGFKREVGQRLGRAQGCSHLSHLAIAMGEAAYQSVARPPIDHPVIRRQAIDGCMALAADGPVLRKFARWVED